MAKIELAQAVAVTAELTGTDLSKVAMKVMIDDLAEYPEQQVLGALLRCRRELKGRLTIADIISRLDDGRPGPEEAWAMIPKSEHESVVWTGEMAQAMGVVHDMLSSRDQVAARMAFKEAYQKLCQRAREAHEPVSWSPSLGWDQGGREAVIREAVIKGRLGASQAKMYIPHLDIEDPVLLDAANKLALSLQAKT